jgi:hypothetical protein
VAVVVGRSPSRRGTYIVEPLTVFPRLLLVRCVATVFPLLFWHMVLQMVAVVLTDSASISRGGESQRRVHVDEVSGTCLSVTVGRVRPFAFGIELERRSNWIVKGTTRTLVLAIITVFGVGANIEHSVRASRFTFAWPSLVSPTLTMTLKSYRCCVCASHNNVGNHN